MRAYEKEAARDGASGLEHVDVKVGRGTRVAEVGRGDMAGAEVEERRDSAALSGADGVGAVGGERGHVYRPGAACNQKQPLRITSLEIESMLLTPWGLRVYDCTHASCRC